MIETIQALAPIYQYAIYAVMVLIVFKIVGASMIELVGSFNSYKFSIIFSATIGVILLVCYLILLVAISYLGYQLVLG